MGRKYAGLVSRRETIGPDEMVLVGEDHRRICVAAITAAFKALTNFNHTSDWVGSLSLASFFLFWRTRQPGESLQTYLSDARAILTNLSALAVVISVVWYFLRHAK